MTKTGIGRRRAAVLAGAAVLAAAGVLARRRLVIVTVRGLSMWPTLRPGDRVLVRRRPGRTVRTGRIVVFRLPPDHREQPLMIKRVRAVSGEDVGDAIAAAHHRTVPAGTIAVLGDNPTASYDSRQFGYVPAAEVLGEVVVTMRASAAPPTRPPHPPSWSVVKSGGSERTG